MIPASADKRAHDCPCDMPETTARRFSRQWYEEHQAHHLATFPDVDQLTRDNLAAMVKWASVCQGVG